MPRRSPIKCVVWNTTTPFWQGILAEGDPTPLRPGAKVLIEALDARGFLLSIASRNDDRALGRLRELGLAEHFLAPQLSFGPRSASLSRVAGELRIGTDSLAFLDDQPIERAEVNHTHPEILPRSPRPLVSPRPPCPAPPARPRPPAESPLPGRAAPPP